jgi:hypothetical protein
MRLKTNKILLFQFEFVSIVFFKEELAFANETKQHKYYYFILFYVK